jgi:transcriptional regulator with XRE-family HTH domain
MAKRKVRPHPGALAEVLKRQNMTQTDAASRSGIDRKTLAKIDRGEEVKEETLQKLASKLDVPATHFDPPSSDSAHREATQPGDPKFLNLMLRNLDAERLAEMLSTTERIQWRLNVHTLDDETIQLLEKLEDAVKSLNTHLNPGFGDPLPDKSLKHELAGLKKTRYVASLLKELSKHHVAILGTQYLVWDCNIELDYPDGIPCPHYFSSRTLCLSIEAQPAQARSAMLWQGEVPPKSAPAHEVIVVNGMRLPNYEEIPF